MLGKPLFIIDHLKNDYDSAITTLTLLPLGADTQACVYKAQSSNLVSYFVKLTHTSLYNDKGVIIQCLLHDKGIKEIISPITTKDGQLTQNSDGFTLIVYPFIEAQDGFSRDLTRDQWINLGKALRQIHTFSVPPLIKQCIKQESYSSQWRDSVRLLYCKIEQEKIVSDEIFVKLSACMKRYKEIIEHVVDRAEVLAKIIQQQSAEFVLCHSDIHAGNVLVSGEALYIVDWDQPIMAPKERDLMFIGGGVANVWNDQHEVDLFYEGYGKTEINRDILSYYRYERIVEDIAVYGQQLLLTAGVGKDREIMYQQFIDMFEEHGVVDIACKTDTNL